MKQIVFYSTQPDAPARTNGSLIERCLKVAVLSISRETQLISSLHDPETKGVSGTIRMTDSILEKIDKCSIFVADVTPFAASENSTAASPNPNVLFQLGYAVKTIGWERILLVLNKAYGRAEDLPFDIRHRHPLIYSATETEQDFKTLREELQKNFIKKLQNLLVKPFSHGGIITFFDDSRTLKISLPQKEKDSFEKRVVLLPLSLRGDPHRILSDIDCYLDFPKGFLPKDLRGLKFAKMRASGSTGNAQTPLSAPKNLMEEAEETEETEEMDELFDESVCLPEIQHPLAGVKPSPVSPESATLTVDGQQVRIHIKKLKAHLLHVFPEIYLLIDPGKGALPAKIKYRISTDSGESLGTLTLHQ